MDRLLSIEVFVKSVELGSFSAAAEALDMSSQLVGKHVRELERHLGVKLIHRTTRRQHLTEIGEGFYERAKKILLELDDARGLAAEAIAVPSGRLRISAPMTFGIHRLAPVLPLYMAQYPRVRVEVSLSNDMIDLIDDGFDAVLRVGELENSGLIARPLQPYRLQLCASPGYVRQQSAIETPADLEAHECLGFSYTELSRRWAFTTPDGVVTVPVQGRLMMDNGEALLQAARAGMGLMLQPEELVADDLARGTLVEVLPEYPVPTRPMHLVYAHDRRMTPKLRSFIDFVLGQFGQ